MSEVSEIKVEWTPQNSGRVSSIQIQSRIRGQYAGAEEGWTEQAAAHDPTAGSFTFGSNAPGTDVEVRARYRMTSGVYGAWFQDGIKTARVTIPYVDLTGTPSRLADINPGEGGKLGGIAPGADVTRDNTAKDTSNVGGTPAATVRDNAGNAIAAIRDASGQLIKSADLIAKADADRAAAAAAVEKAKSELTASVAATNTTVATVRQEAAQVRTDLAPQITAARDAAAKASTDLSDEIARAKGAEGTIATTVTAAQKRADDAFTAISTETTQRADGDRLLSQRLDTVESTATTDRGNLTSRITQEVATLVSRDDAIGRRIDKVEASSGVGRGLNPNGDFANAGSGWSPNGFSFLPNPAGQGYTASSTPGAYSQLYSDKRIKVTDLNRGLRLRIVYRIFAGRSRTYIGLQCFDGAGSHVGNMYAVAATHDPGTYDADYLYKGVLEGVSLPTFRSGVHELPPSTAYVQPLILANYPDDIGTQPNSYTQISEFWLQDVGAVERIDARVTSEATASANRDGAISSRVDSVVAQATTDRTDYNAKINSEATARASVDQALSNKVDVVEARLRGDQDSGLSARIRDEATASVTRDAAITSRTTSLESKAAYTADQVAKTFPGFETTSIIWGWQTELGGRNTGNVGWEPNHEKGAGVAFAPGLGSWLYMDPAGWIKTTPGKRYRAGFWVWQWSAPNGFGGHARVYWEGTNKDYSANTYLGATATSPEATDSFYTPIPNGAWHCYASDIQVDDAIVKNTNCYWIRPRINIDMIPQNGGYVIAGWFFREVTGEWSNAAKITDEATTRAGQDAAIGNRLQIVEANYVTNTQADAKVSAEATARSNETSGLANRIGSVETRYSGAGNLVTNSDIISLDGWQITSQPAGTSFDRNGGGDYWNITGENSITIGENGVASTLCEIVSAPVAVKGGDYVQGYAFAASHRATNWVSIFFYKRDGSWNGYAGEFTSARYNNGGPDLGGWDQTGAKSVRVPDGTATMRLAIRKYQTFSSEAGSIAWFIRPYLGFARQGQTEWNPYVPGSAKAVVNATNARITDEATASANRDSAISNRVATTESQISGGQDSWLAARIRDEATASNNRDNSISNRVATTEAQFRGDQDSGLKTLVRNNRRNLVDVGWWKKGAPIPWGLNGGQRNEIVEFPHGGNFDNLPMPDGSSGDAWLCQADGSGQGAGGWNSGIIAPLDPDKTYRFMIPIATLGSGTRTSYWGTSNVCDINTTNENGNPYFAYIGNLTPNKWHLFVGYLFPRNSAGKTHAGAGVWDMATGIKIADGWNYCFRPDGFQPSHRAYQFYATNGAYQAFGRPIIELVDGSEAPVFAALAASKSATNAQARISDEATASANRDNSLSNRISTTESQMSGGQDSWLAARIRDEATASANRDSSLSNRVTTTEANYTGVRNDLNNWNGDRYQDYLRVNGRVTDEATASANRDNALSNRVSTTEAQIAGGQDSWLAARIRDEATASASRDASISNRTSVVEAQVSNDSGNMLRNGTFNAPGWVGRGGAAIPPGWGGWANDNGAFLGASPRDSRYGAPAPLQIDRGGINNGITQPIYNVAPGWYAFEVDVTGEDGNWSGSGVHVNFNNGYVFNFGFATNADTAGRFGDIGTANRQFTWLFYNGANTGNANLYLMSGWSGFQGGTNFGFFRSVWHRVVMRPATAGEIAAQKVQDSNLVARVSTTESAISTLNGRAAAYWQVQAVAGNNRAQMTVRADANGGGGVDIVGDVNFAGNLNVGADSGGNRMKITNQNIQVFDGNGIRRVAFGLNF